MARVGGAQGDAPQLLGNDASRLLVFLHNFWHLPACDATCLSVSEKRGGSHTHRHAWGVIVILEGVEEVPS